MTPNVNAAIEEAARRAMHSWDGKAVNTRRKSGFADPDYLDLVQDLCVWYQGRPSTRTLIDGLEQHEAVATIRNHAVQLLSDKVLESNVFRGIDIYPSDEIRRALRGESANKYLLDILPTAFDMVNEDHAEAIRSRYIDGVVPHVNSAEKHTLRRAVKSLTAAVNAIAVTAGKDTLSGVRPGTRRASGHSDPTGDLAVALLGVGDDPIELKNKEGNVIGTTTLRAEELSITDPRLGTGPRPEAGPHSLYADEWDKNPRVDMYRAQVFPDLYPREKPMLVDNWPAEDREMYCGGTYTPGYRGHLRVVK